MDKLSALYGIVSAIGTLISTIDHLVTTLRNHGTISAESHDAIKPALGALLDGHTQLVAALPKK